MSSLLRITIFEKCRIYWITDSVVVKYLISIFAAADVALRKGFPGFIQCFWQLPGYYLELHLM